MFTKERHDHYDSREAAYFTVMSIRWGNIYQGKETNTKQKKKKNGQGLTTTIFGISYVTLQIHEKRERKSWRRSNIAKLFFLFNR